MVGDGTCEVVGGGVEETGRSDSLRHGPTSKWLILPVPVRNQQQARPTAAAARAHMIIGTLLEDPDTSDEVTAHLIPAHSNIRSESVRLTDPVAFCCHLHLAPCRHSHSIEIMRSINPCSTSPESFEAVVGGLCGDHIEIVAPVTLPTPTDALVTIHLPASLRTVAPCQTVSSRQGRKLRPSPAAKHCPIHLSWPGSCSMEAWRVVACRLQLVYAD